MSPTKLGEATGAGIEAGVDHSPATGASVLEPGATALAEQLTDIVFCAALVALECLLSYLDVVRLLLLFAFAT